MTKTIPKHYYSNLSQNNKKKQLNEISKSKNLYKKGQYHIRTKMPSFNSKKSKHIVNFENKYTCKITDLKCVSKETNIPIDILKKVINKGMGAYYSSGSRPNQTPHSWGYARLASVLLKQKAYNIDKHLFYKNDKLLEIKSPNKTKISCCKIKDNNTKYKKCIGKNGKIFNLPRKFSKKQCKNIRGFSMKSSCAIYKNVK